MKRRLRKHARKLGVRQLALKHAHKVRIEGAGGAVDRRANRFLAQVLAGNFS